MPHSWYVDSIRKDGNRQVQEGMCMYCAQFHGGCSYQPCTGTAYLDEHILEVSQSRTIWCLAVRGWCFRKWPTTRTVHACLSSPQSSPCALRACGACAPHRRDVFAHVLALSVLLCPCTGPLRVAWWVCELPYRIGAMRSLVCMLMQQ
jgi:hypothetical protein